MLQTFGANAASPATIEERLYHAITVANQEVSALAHANEEMRGMGTTLVAACIDGRKIVIGNVGDSRAYFLRDGGCVQITLDHSYLAEQVRNGVMTEDDAGASPLQSLITRAIGTAETVEPDLFSAALEPGDAILLTTDGLTATPTLMPSASWFSPGRPAAGLPDADRCRQRTGSRGQRDVPPSPRLGRRFSSLTKSRICHPERSRGTCGSHQQARNSVPRPLANRKWRFEPPE